jgi:hypothetical protein
VQILLSLTPAAAACLLESWDCIEAATTAEEVDVDVDSDAIGSALVPPLNCTATAATTTTAAAVVPADFFEKLFAPCGTRTSEVISCVIYKYV